MTFEMHFVCFIPAVSFSRIRDAPFRDFHYHLSHRIYSALIIGGATLRGAPGQTVELPLHSSRAAAATTLIIHHACCVWFMNTICHHATPDTAVDTAKNITARRILSVRTACVPSTRPIATHV